MSYAGDTPSPGAGIPPVRRRGWQGTLISNTTNTGDEQLLTGGGQLFYWNMRETTGSAGAVVELYDGNSVNSQRICSIGMGNGVSDTENFDDNGIPVERGVFKHVVTGSAVVTIGIQLDYGEE